MVHKGLSQPQLDGMHVILLNAVLQIIEHEDFERYLSWGRENMPGYLITEMDMPDEDDMLQAMSYCLARAIWNATPLPGNNFRTSPRPKPGRNDKCPCGSGRKYKQCCSQFAQEFDMIESFVWPVLLDNLPSKVLNEAIMQGQLPVEALLHLAEDYAEQNKTAKAINLLEPLFQGEIKKPDEQYDFALNMLCNFYDILNKDKKKKALLKKIVEGQPRSPLRSGARQRMAAMLVDEGDSKAAWEVFRLAHQDDPDSYSLGILEIQLLLSEDKVEQAGQRADFWVRRLRKLGCPDDEPPLDFFIAVAKDPMQGMIRLSMDITEGMGERLDAWLQKQSTRPLPAYQTSEEPGEFEDKEKLIDHLMGLGMTKKEAEKSVRELEADQPGTTIEHNLTQQALADKEDEEAFPEENLDDGLFLVPPDAIKAVEKKWRNVFHLSKPFSVNDEAFNDAYDPWENEEEEAWSTFLEAHPEAFDSLDIIDDLATALNTHAMVGTPWLDKQVLAPLLKRAAAIIDENLNKHPEPILHWGFADNRPALRSLSRLIMHYFRCGEEQVAYERMQGLIRLNPNDNHGFRCMLIDHFLRSGKDSDALSLADSYPDDMMVEVAFGKVLALYRLGREDEALAALKEATTTFPKVLPYLTKKRIRKPKLDPYGVSFGGDDQAWLYRDGMLEVWQATPGIVDWLKSSKLGIKN